MHALILLLAFVGQAQTGTPHETPEQRHAAAMARAPHNATAVAPPVQDKSNEIPLDKDDQIAMLKAQRTVEENELTLVAIKEKEAEQKTIIDQSKAALDAQVSALRPKYKVSPQDFFNTKDLFFITPPKDKPKTTNQQPIPPPTVH